jgi:hypothetical protein
LRRECLDFLIPFNERHLNLVLKAWIAHFNNAKPHMSMGPGIPAGSRPPRRRALIGIVFLRNIRFAALLFPADYTMSIGSSKSRREARMQFLRTTGIKRAHVELERSAGGLLDPPGR